MSKQNTKLQIIKRIKESIFLDKDYKKFLIDFIKDMPEKNLNIFSKYIEEMKEEQDKFINKALKLHPEIIEEFKVIKKKKISKSIEKEEKHEKKKTKEVLEELEKKLK